MKEFYLVRFSTSLMYTFLKIILSLFKAYSQDFMFNKSIFLILSFMFQGKMNSRTFYGSKVIHHRFLKDTYNEIEESEHEGSIVITGPPNNGEESDIEIEDEDRKKLRNAK